MLLLLLLPITVIATSVALGFIAVTLCYCGFSCG